MAFAWQLARFMNQIVAVRYGAYIFTLSVTSVRPVSIEQGFLESLALRALSKLP
jgi:hypothetical protein